MSEEKVTFAYFSINVPPDALHSAYPSNEKKAAEKGFACVSLMRPPKDSGSDSYTAGVSFCSPLDVNNDYINKKRARLIAEGRRQCDRPGRRIDLKFPRSQTFKLSDVYEAALKKAISEDFVLSKHGMTVTYAPKWAKEAIKMGNNFEWAKKPKGDE